MPRTLEKLFIFRKILYLSPGKMLEITNFYEKSRKSNAENPNGIPRTRPNRIQKWARSSQIIENQRKIEKSTIFHQRNSKDSPRTRQNAFQNWKTMKNRKYTPRTLEKLFIFRKIRYLSPGKMLEIANFDEKSRKANAENPNGIARTRQNRIQKWARSGQIIENRRKVEKIHDVRVAHAAARRRCTGVAL